LQLLHCPLAENIEQVVNLKFHTSIQQLVVMKVTLVALLVIFFTPTILVPEPHSVKKQVKMQQQMLLTAPPCKNLVHTQNFSQSLFLPVKKQNSPRNSLRSPRRVFTGKTSTFLANFS
jgi:hypothetical protein